MVSLFLNHEEMKKSEEKIIILLLLLLIFWIISPLPQGELLAKKIALLLLDLLLL